MNTKQEITPVSGTEVQPYGRYSLGSGSILPDPDRLFSAIDDAEIIQAYENSIRKDLEKAGIPLSAIKEYDILDVGTGRQAITFMRLGARRVRHYDLSRENVERLRLYIESHSLHERMSTECVDLVNYALAAKSFDLVYLNGIVQHFSHVGQGLLNCMQAVKRGGYLWLYFYRSGTLEQFLIYLIRDFIKEVKEVHEYYTNALMLFSEGMKPTYFISGIMDNLFVPYIHLYTPEQYFSFINKCGFEVVASSKLTSPSKNVDHSAHPSVVVTCKRVVMKNLRKCDGDMLSPDKSVNQLDNRMYSSEDKEIMQTIHDYRRLKQMTSSKKVPRSVLMSMAFRMYRFSEECSGGKEAVATHIAFQKLCNTMCEMIDREF